MTGAPERLEAQIAQWRGYVRRHRAIAADDVDEMTDHLRAQVDDLAATGLDAEEAFLVAVRRMGRLDDVSREFAREHSDRLWKQLVLLPGESAAGDAPGDGAPSRWREVWLVLTLALGAGLAVRTAVATVAAPAGEWLLTREISLLVLPFVAAYFAWKRRVPARVLAVVAGAAVALAVLAAVYPFAPGGDTGVLVALHVPVVAWTLLGVVYAGGRWRSDGERMDYVRFTGELVVYLTLLALGGGVLVGLTTGIFALAGVDLEPALGSWILPVCVPGALVVAAWLVEAKKSVVENIAPVLTRVFTPLTVVMLVAALPATLAAGGPGDADRELLILMDAVLVLVLCLVLYTISARDPLAPRGVLDVLQLVLLVAALAVDAVALTAMLTRIAEFGPSPNKVAALGLNLLLMTHLARSAWLSGGFLRGRRGVAALERWQTRFLPVYGLWALVVVVAFPPLFGFV